MTAQRWLAPALIFVGVVLLAVAITYFTVKAQSLPSFMGFIPESDVIRWKRGLAALLVALAFLLLGIREGRRGRGARG